MDGGSFPFIEMMWREAAHVAVHLPHVGTLPCPTVFHNSYTKYVNVVVYSQFSRVLGARRDSSAPAWCARGSACLCGSVVLPCGFRFELCFVALFSSFFNENGVLLHGPGCSPVARIVCTTGGKLQLLGMGVPLARSPL